MLFELLWPNRDDMRYRWNPNATEDYIRQAKVIAVTCLIIGLLVDLVLYQLPFWPVLIPLFSILAIISASIALLAAERAKGVLREIDEAIAPEVRMLQRLSPATRDIVLAHAPVPGHPDDEDDPPDPPGRSRPLPEDAPTLPAPEHTPKLKLLD